LSTKTKKNNCILWLLYNEHMIILYYYFLEQLQ